MCEHVRGPVPRRKGEGVGWGGGRTLHAGGQVAWQPLSRGGVGAGAARVAVALARTHSRTHARASRPSRHATLKGGPVGSSASPWSLTLGSCGRGEAFSLTPHPGEGAARARGVFSPVVPSKGFAAAVQQ